MPLYTAHTENEIEKKVVMVHASLNFHVMTVVVSGYFGNNSMMKELSSSVFFFICLMTSFSVWSLFFKLYSNFKIHHFANFLISFLKNIIT